MKMFNIFICFTESDSSCNSKCEKFDVRDVLT
jgi:hypothetical protein